VATPYAQPGTDVLIDIGGKLRKAQIRKRPLYTPPAAHH